VLGAALAVLGVHGAVVWLTREPSNYSQIEDGLYLGGRVPEPPPDATAVLNLCEIEDPYRAEVHRWEPIPDAEPAPTLDWLRGQVAFVEAQRRAGRTVFIHCRAGVSRCGLVGVAYLMARHGWSCDEALAFTRSSRPVIRPHPAFLRLLQEWEQALQGEPGMTGKR
jgi:protein-tyrosine phosphatase